MRRRLAHAVPSLPCTTPTAVNSSHAGVLFTAANTLWGAELMLDASAQILAPLLLPRLPARWADSLGLSRYARRDDAPPPMDGRQRRLRGARASATLLLAGCGAYYQMVLCGNRQLPVALRAVLFAPLYAETALQYATLAVRGPLASVAQAAGD